MDELFEAYVGTLCTIFIDEAQLLNDDQFEFLRILSDTKLFQFVLAMYYRYRQQSDTNLSQMLLS